MRLQTGHVKCFNHAEGFGFISPSDGGNEVYVNRRAIATTNKSLTEGQMVEFAMYNSSRGPTASDVIVF